MAIHINLLPFGIVEVGLPYSFAGQMRLDEITGGRPFGISAISGGDGSRMPSDNEPKAHASKDATWPMWSGGWRVETARRHKADASGDAYYKHRRREQRSCKPSSENGLMSSIGNEEFVVCFVRT